MAQNENTIGAKAVLDLSEWEKNQRVFDAKLKQLDATMGASLKKINEEAAAIERESKARQAAAEKAAQATEKATRAQAAAHQKMVSDFRRGMVEVGIIAAAAVVAYKKIEEQARRLGDAETVAGFDAMNQATMNLGDSLSAMLFKMTDVGGVLKWLASGVEALRQVLTITGGAATWFGTLFAGALDIIGKRIKEMMGGKIFTSGMDIGAEFSALNARANQAANEVIVASVRAPENVKATASAEENAKAAKEAQDKRLKDVADYYAKITDMQVKSGGDILSAERDLQEKSAAAWSDYIEKTQDIIAEGIKKRAELQQTYLDTVRSAETDYQRGAEDASYSHGKRLADIAREYQNAVNGINRDFGKEALDAARNLDAIGLVRAKEKRDEGLSDAARTRDQSNAEENTNYQRQLYELQRALEDKKREAEIAYQRGLDDQRRAEQESLSEAKSAYNKQQSEAQRAFDERIATIRNQYAQEDAEAQAHYLSQESAFRAHLQQMQAILAQYNIGTMGTPRPSGSGEQEGYANGGAFVTNGPRQITVGEGRSQELVVVQPINRSIPVSSQNMTLNGGFRHQIEASVRSSVAGLDGRISAAVRKAIAEVIR